MKLTREQRIKQKMPDEHHDWCNNCKRQTGTLSREKIRCQICGAEK